MGFRFFIKTRQPKAFEYKPRYFDPRKEALDDLVERVKAEEAGKIPTKNQIRFERNHGVSQLNDSANLKVIVIITILAIVAYFLLR